MIELLVVIAIIAILAALLSPALKAAREQARVLTCLNNQRQVAAALTMYTNDNNGRLPHYCDLGGPPYWFWFELVAPYLKVPSGKTLSVDYMRCPSAPAADGTATLGINYGRTAAAIFGADRGDANQVGSRYLSNVPPATMLTGDHERSTPGGFTIYSPRFYVMGYYGPTVPYNYFGPRHQGAGVCSFADGSARKVPVSDWVNNANEMWGPAP